MELLKTARALEDSTLKPYSLRAGDGLMQGPKDLKPKARFLDFLYSFPKGFIRTVTRGCLLEEG